MVVVSASCSADLAPSGSQTHTGTSGSIPAAEGGRAAAAGTGGEGPAELGSENPTYVKASNAGAQDFFGVSLALSADGATLAVGANGEASSAQGVGGDETDDGAGDSGAVYLFSRADGPWRQELYLKASNTGAGDGFGSTCVLSADGTTLAVGAPAESSSATGVDGNGTDDSAESSGAVYVFSKSADGWVQQAFIKASNADEGDLFGVALALSADGNVLAVGAEAEDGGDAGVNADPTDKSASEAGAVYVFLRSGKSWRQDSYIKASNPDLRDHFGGSVSLSADGGTLAVGAYWEDSVARGIGGDESDNSASGTGAVYVFAHDGAAWDQQVYVKPDRNNGSGRDGFGASIRLSSDGNTLAVGAAGDAGAGNLVGVGEAESTMPYSGAVYLFSKEGTAWNQAAYIKASNADAYDEFGLHLDLSRDGHRLAVGAALEASTATGIDGDGSNDSSAEAGAVYIFENSGSEWSQQAYVKAPNTGLADRFGWAVALADEGDLMAIGALQEDGSVAGINGAQTDDGAPSAGAVYLLSGITELGGE